MMPLLGRANDWVGSIASYSNVQKAIHWGVAVLCVAEFPTAAGIQKRHLGHVFGIKAPTVDLVRAATHEWAGYLVFGLTVLLLLCRTIEGAPPLPAGMRPWERWAAHVAHAAIYLGLFVLVVSGMAAMYVDGRFVFVHMTLTNLGIGLIAIHVAAALWHQFIRRDHLLDRMLRSSKSKPAAD